MRDGPAAIALLNAEPALSHLGMFGRAVRSSRRPAVLVTMRLPKFVLAWIGRKRLRPIEGRVLDVQLAALLAFDDLIGESDLRRLSPPAARRRVEGSVMAVGPAGRREVCSRELRVRGPVCALPCLLYEPPGLPNPSPLVVYYHGGGWVTGSPGSHDGLCRELAALARVRVVSVSYRLAPEAPFPAAVDDALAAFRAIAEKARELGANPARIAVMGDSAGGNLSAVVAQKTRSDELRPALQVLLYPALDATLVEPSHQTYAEEFFLTRPMIDWYYDHYAGKTTDRSHPDLSPLLVEHTEGLPPARVYTAGFDPLLDEGRLYAERLQSAGVPAVHHCFESLTHGFALMSGAVRAARAAVDRIALETAEALHGAEAAQKLA